MAIMPLGRPLALPVLGVLLPVLNVLFLVLSVLLPHLLLQLLPHLLLLLDPWVRATLNHMKHIGFLKIWTSLENSI